ncbi:reverse transcriptase [Caerostris darwini]|uniref:Reverse transcriptase n=1 Tax=Caerostris darwini TaxID=1538125 RepID=A0AAV4N3G3_9ARAC|nr:reverse transcriptase [Caerostris darwini]
MSNEPNSRLSKFGKELRIIDDITNGIRSIIYNVNFAPEITPYLKFSMQVIGTIEKQQVKRKQYADQHRKRSPEFNPGGHVYVTPLVTLAKGRSAKLMPCLDEPYVNLSQISPFSYEISSLDDP